LTPTEFCQLLRALIQTPQVQSLWSVADRGVPVFAHSVDVALLCLEAYPDWRERYPEFRLDVVLVGCVLHDLSKASARHGDGPSHSHIMTHAPHLAVTEAVTALESAQDVAGARLDDEGIDHVWHVIAAHHGRWGKVTPQTPEAYLVAHADNISATRHRIAPVDANDVLPLLEQGYRWPQIGAMLGVNRSVVKARLDDACRAERVRSPTELLERWRAHGAVVPADPDRTRSIERSRFVLEFARNCPEALIAEVRPHLRNVAM
jgi:HD domain